MKFLATRQLNKKLKQKIKSHIFTKNRTWYRKKCGWLDFKEHSGENIFKIKSRNENEMNSFSFQFLGKTP
jgi:hypothetical protein